MSFRYISRRRPPREDRRFVVGRGRYVGDIRFPDMLHVAVLGSPYGHARITSLDVSEAARQPGVAAAVTIADLERDTAPIRQYLNTPGILHYPLARGKVRYAGEWVAAVAAESRADAEDALEAIRAGYEPLPAIEDPEQALLPGAPLVHEAHGSNLAWGNAWTWGDVDGAFARAERTFSYHFRWRRHSGVPIETFAVVARWDESAELLDVWASVQMPQFPDFVAECLRLPTNRVRVHQDVDVGGSYGTKRAIKNAVLCGYLALRTRRPVRFVEDRVEYMRAGEAHGPDRAFDVQAACSADGVVSALKIRVLDDLGAYPGRSPAQLGKPIGSVVGPYRIGAVHYDAAAVTTNKTSQSPFRGFGQAPHNFALERTLDLIARELGVDRAEIRRRNLIPPEAFPYQIPSGTTYDSGDYPQVLAKALAAADYEGLLRRRDAARAEGRLCGVGVAACIEPSGGNAVFLSIINPANETTTFPEGVQVAIDAAGRVTAAIGFPSAGQGHETLVSTVLGEELGVEPAEIVVRHADSLEGLPTQTPVASRMAVVLPGAVHGAAEKLKAKLCRIAAHNLETRVEDVEFHDGRVSVRGAPERGFDWLQLVAIAHKQYHRLPPGEEPGLTETFVWEVPTGGGLPGPDGRVQMYPCFAFSVHVVLAEVDAGTGRVRLDRYVVGHDCGTQVNPQIVEGMIYGGVAHGIGAALYEEFVYAPDGQFLSATFMDYLMPSSHEVPDVEMVEHCTPTPHNPIGSKGTGEGGYMTTPAAVAAAVDDALSPLGVRVAEVPLTPDRVVRLIRGAQAGAAAPHAR